MENELMVCVRTDDIDDVLAGFPYMPGQFNDGCEVDGELTWLRVVLGDRTDTTASQEQWLNSNDRVIEYTIR